MSSHLHRGTSPLGAALIVFSSLFYASYGIWTKLMGTFFGGYTASAIRSVLVLLFLLPAAILLRRISPWQFRRAWPYLLGMILASTLVWGPFYFAILRAGIGLSLTVNYASLVIGLFVFGWLLGRERFTRQKLISTVVGFVGLALVFTPHLNSAIWLALAASALSGFAAAINIVLAKHIPYSATQSTLWLWIASLIANAPMAWLVGEHLPRLSWQLPWLWMVAFAVASVLASWSFVTGTKLIDAGTAGILGLLEIVFGIVFGVIFFAERPGPIVLLGVVTIIAAAVIPYIGSRRTA